MDFSLPPEHSAMLKAAPVRTAGVSAGYTIRTALKSDFQAVDNLLARSYPEILARDYAPSVLAVALPRIARANMRLLRSGSYFVAEGRDGQILGAGGYSLEAPGAMRSSASTGHIRHVVVSHRHQRLGIGAAMMGHALEAAAAEGITRFDCLSTLTAEPFYESLGFTRVGAVELSLAPGVRFPAVQMQM